jgi:hypothetical protein
MDRLEWYCGAIPGGSYIAFSARTEPTKATHPDYGWVWGPFKTKRCARFVARFYGYYNPWQGSMETIEGLAKLHEEGGGIFN